MAKKMIYLIGYPLGHSVSPAMHNAAFAALGFDYKYELLPVKPENLTVAVKKLRQPEIVGFNVTIPHKETIIPLLDELTDSAKLIGAVNTVVNKGGKLTGHNTDGEGFIASLKQEAKFDPKGKKAVVLGAGGASRAVCIMLAANGIRSLGLFDLEKSKAVNLAKVIKEPLVEVIDNNLQAAIQKADLLVNATPIGMRPKIDQCPLAENIKLPSNLLVYDLVYNPQETKLLQKAKKAGCKISYGLGMLVRQGALAFEKWTGKKAPLDIMYQAAQKALKIT